MFRDFVIISNNDKLKFKNTTIKINLYSAVFNLVSQKQSW